MAIRSSSSSPPRAERRRALAAALAVLTFGGCGGETPARPDSAVSVGVTSRLAMPFHGPNGPGAEPMSISFQWTVVLAAAGGPGVTIRAVRTELREPRVARALIAETGSTFDGRLRPDATLLVPQSAGGFFDSALYPGQWEATVTVDVVHPGGRAETLRTAFAFR